MAENRTSSKIAAATARVKISIDEPQPNHEKGFVRFKIRCGGHWLNLFDHRPETYQAVNSLQKSAVQGIALETASAMTALADIVNQPARVLVMKRESDNGPNFPHLVLLPTYERESSAFLTVAQGEITEDLSLWSWQPDRNGPIIILTDEKHPVIIDHDKKTTFFCDEAL